MIHESMLVERGSEKMGRAYVEINPAQPWGVLPLLVAARQWCFMLLQIVPGDAVCFPCAGEDGKDLYGVCRHSPYGMEQVKRFICGSEVIDIGWVEFDRLLKSGRVQWNEEGKVFVIYPT